MVLVLVQLPVLAASGAEETMDHQALKGIAQDGGGLTLELWQSGLLLLQIAIANPR